MQTGYRATNYRMRYHRIRGLGRAGRTQPSEIEVLHLEQIHEVAEQTPESSAVSPGDLLDCSCKTARVRHSAPNAKHVRGSSHFFPGPLGLLSVYWQEALNLEQFAHDGFPPSHRFLRF